MPNLERRVLDQYQPPDRSPYNPESLVRRFERLYEGIRNQNDPVTWRTLVVDTNILLGSLKPDNDMVMEQDFGMATKLVRTLVEDTYLEPLLPEILWSIGMEEEEVVKHAGQWQRALDVLIINGRHHGPKYGKEELLYRVADDFRQKGKSVAVVNPVGHFNDHKTRAVMVPNLMHEVDRVVVIASTQEPNAKDTLADVLGTLRNVEFSSRVNRVDIMMPMFGGSRSDKPGQSPRVGYEHLQAINDPKDLTSKISDSFSEVRRRTLGYAPAATFHSVDVHGSEYPARTFYNEGYDFRNIHPEGIFANQLFEVLDQQDKQGESVSSLPLKVIAFDHGAFERSERFVRHILENPRCCNQQVDLVLVDKSRPDAGEVNDVTVEKVLNYFLNEDSEVECREYESIPSETEPSDEDCVLVSLDDILDRGGTAEANNKVLRVIYPNSKLKIDCYTHVVASSGVRFAMERTDADIVICSNTLCPAELIDYSQDINARTEVYIVNVAPVITEHLDGVGGNFRKE